MADDSKTTRVAVVQMCATPNVAENLATMDRLVKRACSGGAAVVLVPEAFAFLGPEKIKRTLLEPLPAEPYASGGPILEYCRDLAASQLCDLVLGGFHEDADDPDKCFNTCVHIGPDRAIRARYRKIHLFDVSLSDGTQLRESARTLAGDKLVTTEMPFGTLGLSVCYDLRFAYLYQRLVDLGAMALTVPSAFTATTGAAHWHVMLRARAIECQSYVLAPAQHGHNWGKRYSYGHSLIIDPWGEIIAECHDGDDVAVAEIDPARVLQVRQDLPSLRHRRSLE
ncbi:MAG: carbon-nitrogen hydrolase family protein [Pseudomonadales bacterium]